MDYATVVEAIVRTTRDVIGDVAITQAQAVEGIDIDDDGTVTGEADADDLEALLDTYRDIMGKGADGHARQAVQQLYEEDSSVTDLDLPDSILPPEARAEKFADAL